LTLRENHSKRSKIQEIRAAAHYGGTRTPGSGNGWIKKADVSTENLLIELKTTTKDSFSLKVSDLSKIFDQALIDGKMPVFEIEFAERGITCVVLNKEDFHPEKEVP
jgi:hypothetical protein